MLVQSNNNKKRVHTIRGKLNQGLVSNPLVKINSNQEKNITNLQELLMKPKAKTIN